MSKTRYYNPFTDKEVIRTSSSSTDRELSSSHTNTAVKTAADTQPEEISSCNYNPNQFVNTAADQYGSISEASDAIGEYSVETDRLGTHTDDSPSPHLSYEGVPLKEIIPDATIEQIDLDGLDSDFDDIPVNTSVPFRSEVPSPTVSLRSESTDSSANHMNSERLNKNEHVHKKRSVNPFNFFSNINVDDLILIGVIVLLFMEEQDNRDMPLIITLAFLLIIELIEDGKFSFLSA